MKRPSISKKTRFEIFKRDNFTCQYCGSKPDETFLVIDHMTPVKLGGSNDLINLITSCEPCNQGKAARPLNEVHPRPDADLMRLEVHQEISELQRFQTIEQAKADAMGEAVCLIQNSFTEITGMKWQPQDRQIRLMLAKYEPSIVKTAIDALAKKMNHLEAEGEDPRQMNWAAYAWAVCKKTSEKNIAPGFPIGFCSGFFLTVISKVEEGSSGLTVDDFEFLNSSHQPQFLKAWRNCQNPDSPVDHMVHRFLDAAHYFEPLAIEFIHELDSDRINSPGMMAAWADYVLFDQALREADKKWTEEWGAA
jgi:hypothetical protein